MLPVVPDRVLTELGRTEGSPDTLRLLGRDQYTRRLLLLRAVLDAADAADDALCSAGVRARLREDWTLLEEADRTQPPARPVVGAGEGRPDARAPGTRLRDVGIPLSPARACLLHPFVGPWAQSCLRVFGAGRGANREVHGTDHGLTYFSALAAAVAARAGVSYRVRLTARDGVLILPTLGALHTAVQKDATVDVVHRGERLTLSQHGENDVVVHLRDDGVGASSEAAAWRSAYALPGLVPGSAPVPLDDLDPYRVARDVARHHGLSGPVTLDDEERARWRRSWAGAASVLGQGGEHRVSEAVTLLRCMVPLTAPPGAGTGDRSTGSCSGTRREAFGAVLSSTPPTATAFAATLVHELQHTKLAALSDMVTLHRADAAARYFAPWRPDPRPFDGLLQGAYSHLALADFFQRSALAAAGPVGRDSAWTQHARYRVQVGAVLPTLLGARHLTAQGSRFVAQMVGVFERFAEHPAPRGATARAEAFVKTAHARWTQRTPVV
ncbi:aKG-HExxH-type peptide beta-hydroxylase [Streptomyces aureus]